MPIPDYPHVLWILIWVQDLKVRCYSKILYLIWPRDSYVCAVAENQGHTEVGSTEVCEHQWHVHFRPGCLNFFVDLTHK